MDYTFWITLLTEAAFDTLIVGLARAGIVVEPASDDHTYFTPDGDRPRLGCLVAMNVSFADRSRSEIDDMYAAIDAVIVEREIKHHGFVLTENSMGARWESGNVYLTGAPAVGPTPTEG